MNYAIIENFIVTNIALANEPLADNWIACPDNVTMGWGYVDGQFIEPPPFDYSAQNSAQAQTLLTATDWTAIASVADPVVSNPYLTNQAEFLSYRSAVRAIGVKPPTTPATFPTAPTEQWSS